MSGETTSPVVVLSYCPECDALPGDCAHTGYRYLDPPTWERVPGEGWRVPLDEIERWESPPRIGGPARPEEQAKSIQRLVVELEEWIDLDARLERKLREGYDRAPLKVTRIVGTVIAAAQSGRQLSPGGLLHNRLREIDG